ncbi:MAG: hypothetical protein IKR33_00425, partial [Bacteroidales bacterium]|nr:hypothetical protein [Bacteroidales bacterium]
MKNDLAVLEKSRTFAVDFNRKSRSVISSSCNWKPEKFSSDARKYDGFARVSVGCCLFLRHKVILRT